jgi:hypothetical protein
MMFSLCIFVFVTLYVLFSFLTTFSCLDFGIVDIYFSQVAHMLL